MNELLPFLERAAQMMAPLIAAELAKATPNPNELLTVQKLAKELHLGPSTVRALIDAGTLARVKDIAERRVSRRELERYTAGRKR